MGGRTKSERYSNKCEKYNIIKDIWKSAPYLNESKINIGAVSVDSIIIYVFGGSNRTFVNTIECLNTIQDDSAWTIVKLTSSYDWFGKDELGCLQLSKNELIIFGGILEREGCTKDTFTFKINERSITKNEAKLSVKESFVCLNPIRLKDGRIYISGSYLNDIHVFSLDDQLWNIIKMEKNKIIT